APSTVAAGVGLERLRLLAVCCQGCTVAHRPMERRLRTVERNAGRRSAGGDRTQLITDACTVGELAEHGEAVGHVHTLRRSIGAARTLVDRDAAVRDDGEGIAEPALDDLGIDA